MRTFMNSFYDILLFSINVIKFQFSRTTGSWLFKSETNDQKYQYNLLLDYRCSADQLNNEIHQNC